MRDDDFIESLETDLIAFNRLVEDYRYQIAGVKVEPLELAA